MTVLQRSPLHAVKVIQPGLWQIVFHLPATTNCWLWKEPDGLTLIDAANAWNAKAILQAIDSIGLPLRRIVITHAHPDHAGAAAALAVATGAVVLAHSAEIPFLQGKCMSRESGKNLVCRALLTAGSRLGILSPPAIQNVAPLADDGEVGRLRVVHTPGHTPGSISLWSEEEKALFCGDNLVHSFFAVRVGMSCFTLDLKTQKVSLERYAGLGAQVLLSGHGPVYRGDFANQMKRILANG